MFAVISSCSTTKPIKGEDSWDGIKLYKPMPELDLFIATDKSTIKYHDVDAKYLLISVDDYLEICALIESAAFWNKKMFFEYLKNSKNKNLDP